VAGIRLTPFLDHFKEDSLYFEHFFANGVQTARGLFASFCSYYPRQGTAAMKTRYMHDYVCIPSVLREHGYRTEMVIGYHRDLNRLHLFMSRNGLHQLFDRSDFPTGIEEIGMSASVGKPDGALLDLMRTRVQALRANGKPYFLAAMTIALVGTSIMVGTSFRVSLQHLWGDALGLVTAVFYAGYILTVKQLREESSVATIMARGGAVTSLALLPIAIFSGETIMPPTWYGWAVLLALALISQVSGQSLIAYALAHLPAAFSSVGLLLQQL